MCKEEEVEGEASSQTDVLADTSRDNDEGSSPFISYKYIYLYVYTFFKKKKNFYL